VGNCPQYILAPDQYCKLNKMTWRNGFLLTGVAQAAQVGIAACSLTYGFDTDFDAVLFTKGPVLVANMTRFFPIGSNGTINSNAMFETFNEDFTAHT
jgi:hypothetical protein